MRVFKIENNSLTSYKEEDFKIDNTEKILEDWIENTPDAIFENEDFKDRKGERIITCGFVVKKDKAIGGSTESRQKIDKKKFLNNVDYALPL